MNAPTIAQKLQASYDHLMELSQQVNQLANDLPTYGKACRYSPIRKYMEQRFDQLLRRVEVQNKIINRLQRQAMA